MYKFHTPQEYHEIILKTEQEIEEQYQLQQLERWVADPRNAAQLAQIRAEFDRVAPLPQQRPAAQPTPNTLPAVINGDAKFHPSHLKMRRAGSQVESISDPLVMSPGATIRQR